MGRVNRWRLSEAVHKRQIRAAGSVRVRRCGRAFAAAGYDAERRAEPGVRAPLAPWLWAQRAWRQAARQNAIASCEWAYYGGADTALVM